MSVGSRIKELRESKNISRNKLADLIGVTVGAISNYENEVSSPKEPILFKIMEVLQCDANYLFQDAIDMPSMENSVSIEEHKIIKKYRTLDSHGKEMVDFTLEKEWERSTTTHRDKIYTYGADNLTTMVAEESSSYLSDNKFSYELNAAHSRTDIEPEEGADTNEDAIMDDKDF